MKGRIIVIEFSADQYDFICLMMEASGAGMQEIIRRLLVIGYKAYKKDRGLL